MIEARARPRERRARVAVLTNKPLRHTERLLDGLGVRQLFDDVIGGDGPHPAQAGAAGPARADGRGRCDGSATR